MSHHEDVYQKGEFKLVEWEDVNYCEHYFQKDEEQLSDEEVVDLLNKLSREPNMIKHIIREAYLTERTMLGKSVLKQLMERIGIE